MVFKDRPRGGVTFPALIDDKEELPVGAGERPNIELGGQKDPSRMSRINADAATRVNKVSAEVRKALNTEATFQPTSMTEEVELNVGDAPDLPDPFYERSV